MHVADFIREGALTTHAYLAFGDTDALYEPCIRAVEARAGALGLADVYTEHTDSLGVIEARALAAFASFKPVSGTKYLLVVAKTITPEAQSALLKVVEDAPGHSIFFFVVEAGSPILDTMRSRCVVLSGATEHDTERGVEFLTLPVPSRLKVAEAFGVSQDRDGARALVRSLLALADDRRFSALQLSDLLDAERFLALSGSSPKSIVGHLALTL